MNVRTVAPLLAGVACLLSCGRYAWLTYGPPAGAPRFECREAVAHLGPVCAGQERRHAFEIHNSGGRPLAVKAAAGCGRCTHLPVPALTVPPGGREALPVVLATAGEAPGGHNYRILLETNDPSLPHVILQITGETTSPH